MGFARFRRDTAGPICMRLVRKLSVPAALMLGLLLFLIAIPLDHTGQLAHAAPAVHSQGANAASPSVAGSGKTAGNGATGNGKNEALLVAEVLLLLVVGRVLGEGMQRIGQPALMGTLLGGSFWGHPCSVGYGPARSISFSHGMKPRKA